MFIALHNFFSEFLSYVYLFEREERKKINFKTIFKKTEIYTITQSLSGQQLP